MKSRKSQYAALSLATALSLVAPHGWAQSAPPAAAPEASEVEDETVVLSPFVVDSSEDADSYQAKATLAGSRIRTELKDVGSAIQVVTAQFLKDTGATSNETLLQYTTNTEVSGQWGNFAGLGNARNLDDTNQRMAPHQNTRVRGLAQADNTRDFFLTDIPWDSYNVGRVDLQRGPNAILFGMGSPAGIVNTSVNGASFDTGGSIEARFGSYGSLRGSLDWNQVLLDDQLAVRVSMLQDKTNYRQDPAFNKDRRLFGSLRWDPKFLRSESARTQLNIKAEKGEIRANRPRVLPPGDLITAWWTDPALANLRLSGGMSALTLGEGDGPTLAALRAAGDMGAGVRGSNSNYVNRSIGPLGRNYGGIVAVFPDTNSSAHHLMLTEVSKSVTNQVTMPWTILSGVIARKDREGVLQNKPNYDFYRDEVLRDRTIFDSYNNLIDGPNKSEWNDFETVNVALSQTFFDNKLGFEAVYDRQYVVRGQTNLASDYGQAITLDVNNTLVDGTRNPNFGRAVMVSDQFANNSFESDRESKRLTLFGELDFRERFGENAITRALGRNVITALWANEEYDQETRSWFLYVADESYGRELLAGDIALRNRGVQTMNYLSDNIASRGTISGANIGRIRASRVPTVNTLNVFDTTWTATGVNPNDPWTNQYGAVSTQAKNPANYRGWAGPDRNLYIISDANGERNNLTTNAQLIRDVTDTVAGNWQAYMFDGLVVPSFGIRRDERTNYGIFDDNGNPFLPKVPGVDTVDLTSPDYRLSRGATVSDNTKTTSIVLHTPQSWRERLPWNTGVSLFYSKSDNFQPAAGRIDVYGNALPAPTGETEDYGFMISALEDRLSLKVNWYDTVAQDAALDNFGGSYMIWGAEAWAYGFARANQLRVAAGGWADFTQGYNPLGIVAATTPAGGWTPAQIAQGQAVGDAITSAYFQNLLPASWYQLWQIPTASADAGNFIWGSTPQGFTITGDTRSRGVEFEVHAQPVRNWNIAVNASKTNAERTNMAGSLIDWVESRWEVYNTPVTLNNQPITLNTPNGTRQAVIGDVRFWNGNYDDNETLRGKFLREFMSGYWLYRIQEGSNVPELRPWKFNLITNYNFESGFLKNINVGGSYRWQDKVVTGYPILPGATINDPRAFDLENPYMGNAESHVDLWAGYQRKLTEKISWRIQVNVRNVFADDDLIPITVQPDGSLAAGRIPEPRTWTIANTFSF